MAKLIECGDCGHMVSKSADFCPNCGARFKLRWYEGSWSTVFKAVLIILLIPILLGFLGALLGE